MIVVASIFAALAALLHVYIFVMESLWWTRPRTRKTFGIPSAEVAETTKSLAYNQGFYNLFLAIGVIIGFVLLAVGEPEAGRALVLFSLASMFVAALVLVTADSTKARAAATQGTLPLIGFVLFLFV